MTREEEEGGLAIFGSLPLLFFFFFSLRSARALLKLLGALYTGRPHNNPITFATKKVMTT